MRRGVIVLNDPNGLSKAMNKLYLQTFPESVRPRTLVTRSLSRVQKFLDEEGTIIVKPLQGSGGAGVFIVRRNEVHNLEDIFDVGQPRRIRDRPSSTCRPPRKATRDCF